jgi:hypothetical protein
MVKKHMVKQIMNFCHKVLPHMVAVLLSLSYSVTSGGILIETACRSPQLAAQRAGLTGVSQLIRRTRRCIAGLYLIVALIIIKTRPFL